MKVITNGNVEIDLGAVEATPTIGIIDFSRRETDDFGVTTVVERGFARRMSVRLALPFENVDEVQRRLADLRATPALWVADERFAWLNVRGFYKDFELDLAVPPLSYCTLTVEGLAETEAAPDLGGDPAPTGSASTLRLINPVDVTPSVLAASNVPENDHAEWAAGATYAVGDRVIKAATHHVYESLVAGNIGHDPAAASGEWIDIGPTNRWAMFDQALGTSTTAWSNVTVTLDVPGATAVALLDVVALSVRVQAPGYDRTQSAIGGAITFIDLPQANGPVTVTITGGGQVSVGTLLVGRIVALGITGESPTAGIADFSRKEVDDFGEVTVVPRAWAKRMAARALIRTDAIDAVANRIATVRARPCLWIGDEGLDSLTVYGFFKDFSIEVGEGVSTLSLSIEGLSEAAPVGVLAPNWTDIVDNDPAGRPKPQDGATVGAPVGTPVGDRPAEQLLEQVDGARSDIDDLWETYGDTASAAESKAAAALSASQAEQARAQAAQAFSDAHAAQQAAEGAQAAALGHAGTAEAAKVAAAASASAATTAKGAAEQARDAAQTRAQEADASAQASAGSAQQAATSKDAAATSASAAAASQVSARLQAAALFPSTLEGDGAFFTSIGYGQGTNAPPLSGVVTTADGLAFAATPANTAGHIGTVGLVRYEPGKVYDLEAKVRAITGADMGAGLWVTPMTASFGIPPSLANAGGIFVPGADAIKATPVGQVTALSGRMVLPDVPGAVWLRFGVLINRQNGGFATIVDPSTVNFLGLSVRDATSAALAKASADASAASASSAAASQSGAQQEAAAAQQERVAAQTAKSDALAARDAAAQSQSDAAGSASSAQQSATTSATAKTAAEQARDAAAGSASAAAGSASSAGASATLAGQKAEAASASATSADTSRSQAQAAQSQAAQSQSDAAGSASSAAQSASTSATAKTAAEQARDAASASASAAATSASAASASQSAAGQSASAADSARVAAQTAQGAAEVAQSSAASSASGAAGSASAASASQSLSASSAAAAGVSLAKMFPRTLSPQAYTWANTGGSELNNNPPLPSEVLVGSVIHLNTDSSLPYNYPFGIWCRMPVPWTMDRAYRITSKLQQLGGASSWAAGYGVYYDAFGNYVGEGLVGGQTALDGSVKDLSYNFVCGINGVPAGTAFMRFGMVTQRVIGSIGATQSGLTAVHALYIDDITSQRAADASASAAATSASAASASKDAAGNSASAANQSKLDAQAANTSATTQAGVAQSAAAAAASSSAAAQTSAVLSARMSYGMLNKNPAFADLGVAYDNGRPVATGWGYWWGLPQAANLVMDDQAPSGRKWQITAAVNQITGFSGALFPMRRGYYVLDAQWELGDGDMTGLRVYVSGQANGSEVWGNEHLLADFTEASGVQVKNSGLSGFRRIRAQKLIFVDCPTTVNQGALVMMMNWSGAQPYKYVWFEFLGIRPATQQEITTQQVLPTLQANVSTLQSVAASIDGRTQAHWALSGNAGNASFAIEARAITTPGGAAQSAVGIVADEFSVKNSQSRKSVLRIAGQEVLIDGNLTATSGIFLGSGVKWQVALRQKTYSLADGQAVSFAPLDLGNYVVEFAGDNLAPLAAGETYKLYADAKTGAGFTPRIKIVTPGASSSASVGPGTGSSTGPSVQVARGSNGEASNGSYTVSVSGTYSGNAYNYYQ